MTKRHLKTPEKIIKALKEGKEVKDSEGYVYKMIEGVIVSNVDGKTAVNDILFLDESYYTEEPDPLNIEEGKFYKTRAGKKAFCIYADKEDGSFRMAPMGDTCAETWWVDKNGHCLSEEDDYNIVSEWSDGEEGNIHENPELLEKKK